MNGTGITGRITFYWRSSSRARVRFVYSDSETVERNTVSTAWGCSSGPWLLRTY